MHSLNKLRSQLEKILDPAERVFVVVSLIHYSAAILPVLITQGASEGDGADISSFNFSINNYFFLLNYMIVCGLLALRWKKAIKILSGNYLFLALIALMPLSIMWSAKPDETLSGSLGMVGTLLFAIYIASRFTIKEQLKLICWTFGVSMVISALFIVLLPKYGVMGGVHAGTFRGAYTHKNQFGKAMVMSLTMFLVYARSCGAKNWWAWTGVFFSTIFVLISSSSAALVNSLALFFVVTISQVFRWNKKYFLLGICLSIATVFVFSQWALTLAEVIVDAFGKDLTLTGRTDIWPYTIAKIQERPWLGYGFNGFWHGIQGESVFMRLAVRWKVPNSHNGFLDLIIELGFVGFGIFMLLMWTLFLKNIFILRKRFSWHYVWPIAFLVYTVLVNLTETALIIQNNFYWLIFIVVSLSLTQEFKQLTQAPPKPPQLIVAGKAPQEVGQQG